jgi:hypothetical protein
VGDEESVVWNTFVTGTPTAVDDAGAGDRPTADGRRRRRRG